MTESHEALDRLSPEALGKRFSPEALKSIFEHAQESFELLQRTGHATEWERRFYIEWEIAFEEGLAASRLSRDERLRRLAEPYMHL